MVEIVSTKIIVDAVIKNVEDPAAGGIDVFIGTTRNNANGKRVLHLEYEAYQPMAIKMLHRIAEDVKSKWKVINIAIVHRIGRLEIGEPSVVIAVSSAHRAEAFEACRFAIDTLKIRLWDIMMAPCFTIS